MEIIPNLEEVHVYEFVLVFGALALMCVLAAMSVLARAKVAQDVRREL